MRTDSVLAFRITVRTAAGLAIALAVALATLPSVPARADDAPADAPAGKEPPKPAKSETELLLEKLTDAKFAQNRIDGATAAKSVQDPKLTPVLVKLLKDEHPDVRMAAIEALGNRTSAEQKKEAAKGLAARIKMLDGKRELQAELLAVVASLHDLAQVVSIEALLDGCRDDTDLDLMEARTRAVANVPSAEAIEKLIDYMSRGRRGDGRAGIFAKALATATGERAVNDPDHWRAWWKENKATFDFDAAADKRDEDRKKKDEAAKRRERKDGDGKKDPK